MPAVRVIALVLFFGAAASAAPFTDLFVFGDSLSDVGNDDRTTFGFFPGSFYSDGRFSNGPVYAEWLAEGLGLGPLTPSEAGGDNYAFGGARTSGSGAAGLFIDDLDDQVDDFLANRTVDPGALHAVFIGANDFFDGETNVQTPVDQITADLGRLADAGAESFLVLNLPLLGLTPAFNGSEGGSAATAAEFNQRTVDFNAAFDAALDGFEAARPAVDLFRLDVAGLLSGLIADAERRGFGNTVDAAAPGLRPGPQPFFTPDIVDNPDEHLFWDDVHPTAAVHRVLGFEAIRAVLPAGDYNRDGRVTIDDYLAWRDAFGSTEDLAADGNGDGVVDAADYTLWRDNFLRPDDGVSASGAVPEPSAVLLAALAALVAPGRPRKTRP